MNKFIVNNIKIIEDFLKLDITNKTNKKISPTKVVTTKPKIETKPAIQIISPFDEMPNLPPQSRKSSTNILNNDIMPPNSDSFKKRSSIQDIINQHKKSSQVGGTTMNYNSIDNKNTEKDDNDDNFYILKL